MVPGGKDCVMDTITITGNVATAPERRTTASGIPVTTFRVAAGQRRFDKESEKWVESATNWYTVSAFRALGEHAYMSLHRGERVIVTGRLRLRDWETPTKRGTSAEIDADAVGHDLLWGTSVFRRFEQSAPGESRASESWSVEAVPEAGKDDDGWNAPGLAPAETEGDAAAEEARRRLDELLPETDRALALAGASEEAPF
jgi:single-strand DNA-binding protein